MMSRAVVFLFAFLSLFATSQIFAAPVNDIAARQLGGLLCNLGGLTSGLSTVQGLLGSLTSQVTSEPAVAAGIKTATDALSSVESTIGSVTGGLTGGLLGGLTAAPAGVLDQITGNLTNAQSILSGLTSSDPDVVAILGKAVQQISSSTGSGKGLLGLLGSC